MESRFVPVAWTEILPETRRHYAALPSATDAFHEEQVLGSQHYRILVEGAAVGFVSIRERQVITQFALAGPYRHLGQPFFDRLKRFDQITTALVPTNDEFFLAHALDAYRDLAMQACFFALAPERVPPVPTGFALRPATPRDIPLVATESGDFFAPIERYVDAGELFITERDDQLAGFGLMEVSQLHQQTASIGMFTPEQFRNQGIGAATITLLIRECQRRDVRPVAGCWFYNHASRRTLENAGLYAPTRYLRVSF
jgi:RimJ/RimL family protein N-acetyltransferase